MIRGRGSRKVQLVIAFRWMTAIWPVNGFGQAKIVSPSDGRMMCASLNSGAFLGLFEDLREALPEVVCGVRLQLLMAGMAQLPPEAVVGPEPLDAVHDGVE